MNEFEKRIRSRISDLEMLPSRGGRVLAGVSGGADSVCLLLVLAALREDLDFDLRAIHIHHGLRERAGEDLTFTQDLCAGLQVPCRTRYVDAAAYAAGHGLGVEEACRILRYQCFEQACLEWEAEGPGPDGQNGSCRIAVAHHMEDQAETVLFHICRGSSIAGLRGMLPVSGRLIRPLLEETRDQIETYLREKGQTWRTDETNLDPSYTRNRLRLQILPLLEQYVNPAALRLAYRQPSAALPEAADYYVFDTGDSFVIVAGDDRAQAVLAYGDGLPDMAARAFTAADPLPSADRGGRQEKGYRGSPYPGPSAAGPYRGQRPAGSAGRRDGPQKLRQTDFLETRSAGAGSCFGKRAPGQRYRPAAFGRSLSGNGLSL